MVADLNFDGYLLITGSAGHTNPDGHVIRSIKVFDPMQKEKQSIYDYEAERDTEEYIRITEGTKETKDILHEEAPIESVSDASLIESINLYNKNMKAKFNYLQASVDHHVQKVNKLYSDLPKKSHIIPTLELSQQVSNALESVKQHI
jgi:ribosomal protein S16